jgi:hypothetical protein
VPSRLEEQWVANAAAWEADFCSHMDGVEDSTRVWLDTLAEHTQLQKDKTAGQSPAEVRALQQCQANTPIASRDTVMHDVCYAYMMYACESCSSAQAAMPRPC